MSLLQSQVHTGMHQHHGSSASSVNSYSPGCAGDQLSKTNLYIRGLLPETTDADLYNMCERLCSKFGFRSVPEMLCVYAVCACVIKVCECHVS